MNAVAERPLPPLAERTKIHKLDLAYQIAEAIRTIAYGPNRFTSTFCTHYVRLENLVKFLGRDELKAYANNGYMTVPWNAKTLHQLALEVDEMQSKLLASLKAELADAPSQADFDEYMRGVIENDEAATMGDASTWQN